MAKKIAKQDATSVEFAACIGLDWGDREHSVCLQVTGSSKVEKWRLKHQPADLESWLLGLRERFEGRPITVCLELTRGPIVSVLLGHEFVTVFPVNPQTLARYREAWSPSGAKDDPSDALLALEVLSKHRDKLTPKRRDARVTATGRRPSLYCRAACTPHQSIDRGAEGVLPSGFGVV
jgi:Transposase